MDADCKRPTGSKSTPPLVREAHDAEHERALTGDPSHEQAKLEIGLDESFPSSDPPAVVQPGNGDPAPSSGFNEKAERQRQRDRR
jgi:hypothetical protein